MSLPAEDDIQETDQHLNNAQKVGDFRALGPKGMSLSNHQGSMWIRNSM